MIRQWPWQHIKGAAVPYGEPESYLRAVDWLDGHGDVVEWGCGFAYPRTLFKRSHYVGVDGCNGNADRLVDLSDFKEPSDCILIRYVLEHNLDWEQILKNAVKAFRRRMFLAVSIPFSEDSEVHDVKKTGFAPDLSVPREMMVRHFEKYIDHEENLARVQSGNEYRPNEHLFYLIKPADKEVQ